MDKAEQVPLGDVIGTAELRRRPARPPDYEGERRALTDLVSVLADQQGGAADPSPGIGSVLQKLAEHALELCRAQSAGVSLLQDDGGEEQFRWRAAAGKWSVSRGETMPRPTPCGTVLDQDKAFLMVYPQRHLAYADNTLPIAEALLVPFRTRGKTTGAIWVVSHDGERRFDTEDERLLTSLGRFAATITRQLLEQEHLARELEATRQLQAVSAQLPGEGTSDALYGRILDAAIAVMRSDFASIQLVESESGAKGQLRLLGQRGFTAEAAQFWSWVRPTSESSCGIALRTRMRVVVPDIEIYDFMAGTDDLEGYRQCGIRAVQTTPLVSRRGELLGMLSTHWRRVRNPSERELQLFDALARQAADLMERTKADEDLRRSTERQRFLLVLGDALRSPADPVEMQMEASRLLGEHLQVNRVSYGDIDGADCIVRKGYVDGVTPLAGRFPMAAFGAALLEAYQRGEVVAVEDIDSDPRFTELERTTLRAFEIAAFVSVMLIKGGKWVAAFGVQNATPRKWTKEAIELVSDVAERIWSAGERARTENELRDSDERFRQFGRASSDVLWIRDADTFRCEYVSPAYEAVYGTSPERMVGSDFAHWAGLMVPEDRDRTKRCVARVGRGESVSYEFRIVRPSDGQTRWLRSSAFPLRDASRRIRHIGGITRDVTELKDTSARSEVLVAELQHRTRNLLAVVRTLATSTLDVSTSLEGFRAEFLERLAALSRVQGLLSRSDREPITIGALLEMELDAHGADAFRDRIITTGPPVRLRSSTVQTIALALHELATNALKHGALSTPAGRLEINWGLQLSSEAPRLALSWIETGLPANDGAASFGYGRELIENALPYSLGARTSFLLDASSLRCTIDLPLQRPRD